MYIWLFTLTALVWLWLCVGVVAGWRRGAFGALLALSFLGSVSVLAALVLAVFGPYAMVVYSVLLQPS